MIAARDWYAEVLGIEPYFQRPEEGPPAYIEFRIGADEDELGLIDRRYAPPVTPRDPVGRSSTGRSMTCRLRLTGC